MRRLKLTQIAAPDKQSIRTKLKAYGVSFAPGVHKRYKNMHHARGDLARYSDLLNDILIDMNILVTDLFGHYRAAWFYFEDRPSGRVHTTTEHIIRKSTLDALEAMDKLTGPYVRTFHNFGAYNMTTTALEAMQTGFTQLENFFAKRSDWARVAQLKIQKRRCATHSARLQQFLDGLTDRI